MSSLRWLFLVLVLVAGGVVLVQSCPDRDGSRSGRGEPTHATHVVQDSSPAPTAAPEREIVSGDGAATSASASPDTIAGIVTERSGAPLEAAECRLHRGVPASGFAVRADDDGASASTLSAADGSFRLPAGPGSWRVVVQRPGFARWERDHVVAGDELTVRLDPVVELLVSVVGPRGEPVADAEVVVRAAGARASEDARCRMRTDPGGRAWSAELAPGDWYLTGRHPEHGVAGVPLAIPAGLFRVETEIELARGIRLTGTVSDALGAPINGARVRVESPYRDVFLVEEATTDASGRYATAAVFSVPETLEVLARAATYGEATVFVGIGPEHVQAGEAVLDFRLAPGGRSLVGRAVDAAGAGVADALVRVAALEPVGASPEDVLFALRSAPSEAWLWQEVARTGVDGRFEVAGLASANEYALLLVREPFAPRMVWAPPGDAGTVTDLGELELLAWGSLFGRARHADGSPAESTKLWLHRRTRIHVGGREEHARWRPDAWFLPLETRTHEGGAFRFDGLAPGTYELGSAEIDVGPGSAVGPVEVVVPDERPSGALRELRGVVADRAGRELPLVFVRAFALDERGAERFVGASRTDERGAFALRIPAGASARLAFSDLRGEHEDGEERVGPGSAAEALRIVLAERAGDAPPLEGVVLDPQGRPVEGCSVRLHPPEDALCACVSFETRTDAAGAFRFARVSAGPHRIVVADPRFESALHHPARPGEPVLIQLAERR
jgi:protocatechuate 3,4-dioxygenase beta subunit